MKNPTKILSRLMLCSIFALSSSAQNYKTKTTVPDANPAMENSKEKKDLPQKIVVYNPLPWKRDGNIALDTRLIFGNDFVSLKPVDGGPAIAVSHEYPAIDVKAVMTGVLPGPGQAQKTFESPHISRYTQIRELHLKKLTSHALHFVTTI